MNAKATNVIKKKTLAKADTAVARPLLTDVRKMILQTRENVARSVDSALTTRYWHVGCRVRQDILKEKRAEYGGQIVSALLRQFAWTHFKSLSSDTDRLARARLESGKD